MKFMDSGEVVVMFHATLECRLEYVLAVNVLDIENVWFMWFKSMYTRI